MGQKVFTEYLYLRLDYATFQPIIVDSNSTGSLIFADGTLAFVSNSSEREKSGPGWNISDQITDSTVVTDAAGCVSPPGRLTADIAFEMILSSSPHAQISGLR